MRPLIAILTAAMVACGAAVAGPASMLQDDENVVHVRVERVIDGDTIVVDGGERVRLLGLDTPERGQPYFEASTARLTSLLDVAEPAHTVSLSFDSRGRTTDQYGRTLAYVWVSVLGEQVDVARILIAEGLAEASGYPSDYREFYKSVELDAKRQRLGIWSNFPKEEARRGNVVLAAERAQYSQPLRDGIEQRRELVRLLRLICVWTAPDAESEAACRSV